MTLEILGEQAQRLRGPAQLMQCPAQILLQWCVTCEGALRCAERPACFLQRRACLGRDFCIEPSDELIRILQRAVQRL